MLIQHVIRINLLAPTEAIRIVDGNDIYPEFICERARNEQLLSFSINTFEEQTWKFIASRVFILRKRSKRQYQNIRLACNLQII